MANRRYIDFPIASSVGDNDIILIWQSGANKQTTKATFLSGLPENLEDLNDVVISGLTNGQILRYDSVTGKWENTDQGNLDLSDLNDVSIVSPSNGQVLVYNSSTSQWENSSGGFVPYVGAVTTVDLGAQGLRAGYLRFDTSIVGVPNEQGLMFWDADDETVDIILNGYTMKIGEDLFYPVKNQTGSTIAKGVAVRFNGTVGASGRLLIAPFIADGSVPSSRFMGVTAEEILNGEDGKVLYFGRVRGINTNAFNEGDILYASTTVAGGYQTAIPVAPNNIVQVAAVVTKSATVGTIFIRPVLASNLNTDEAVKLTSVADKNLLQYQSGTSLWENKTLAQVIGSAYVPSTRNITINGTTQDLSADRTYNVGTVTSVGLSSATSGVTIGSSPVTTSGTITLAIATASGSQNGLLSSTDWTTFNSKQNVLTNPVTGTGTTNYLPKFTGASTIGNSLIFDDGTNVGIGTATPTSFGAGYTVASINGSSGGGVLDLMVNTTRVLTLAVDGSLPSISSRVSGFPIVLRTNNGGTVDERFRIFSDGNVLIQSGGTFTNNGARLQVSGTARITGNLTLDTSSLILGLGNGGNNEAVYFNYNSNAASRSWRILKDWTVFGDFQIQQSTTQTGTTYADILRFLPTGAATFSSTINSGDITVNGNNKGLYFNGTRNAILGNASLEEIYLATANVTRVTIASSGNVEIGTTGFSSPSGADRFVGVYGAQDCSLILQDNVQLWELYVNDDFYINRGSTNVLSLNRTSGAAIFSSVVVSPIFSGENTTSSSANLQSWNKATTGDNKFVEFYTEGGGGTLRGSIDYNRGAGLVRYNTTSDANLKNIIGDSDKQKSVNILKLTRIREYSWKDDKLNKTQIGVIAQELYNTYKGAVSVGSELELLGTENYKPWAIDKTAFTFHLIAGWQEHERIIKELKAEIDNLKN